MASIQRVFIGKVNKVEDEETFAVKVSFIGENDLGEDGPTALPFGNINSEIKEEDKIILFQIDERPYSFFYLPLTLNTGKVWIYKEDTFIDITNPDEMIIQHQDKCFVMSKGDLYINVDSVMKILGTGKLELKGIVSKPDNSAYALNFLPACLFTGGSHGGCELQLTGQPEQPSEKE